MIPPQPRYFAATALLMLYISVTGAEDYERCAADDKPEEGLNACPCRSGPFNMLDDFVYPKVWDTLTPTEQCQVRGRCGKIAQCCVDLCEKGVDNYVCDDEIDCKRIDQTGKFLECKFGQSCVQWNYDECAPDSIENKPRGIMCFCRKYSKSCSNL